jgi:hypothetical protein
MWKQWLKITANKAGLYKQILEKTGIKEREKCLKLREREFR